MHLTPARSRKGTTFAELMMVLVIIGILMTISIAAYKKEPSPSQAADDGAYALAHGIEAIRTQGLVSHTDAEITTSGTSGDPMDVHFLKVAQNGGTTDVSLIGDSKTLRETVHYGAGRATTSPMGNAITAAVPATVTCTSSSTSLASCYVGTVVPSQVTATSVADPIIYYLTIAGHSDVVRAIVISPRGEVTIYHYNAGTNGWN